MYRTFRFVPLLLMLVFFLFACAQGPTTLIPGHGKEATITLQPDYTIADLLQRPLRLPQLKAGISCPASPARRVNTDFGIAQGEGPAYATIGEQDIPQTVVLHYADATHFGQGESANRGWGGQKVLWFVDPHYQGLILVRGRQLNGVHELRFDDPPQPYLVLDASLGSQAQWFNAATYTRLQAPGCYSYQVDGYNFSYTITFQAIPG